jgi:hypothetical protein
MRIYKVTFHCKTLKDLGAVCDLSVGPIVVSLISNTLKESPVKPEKIAKKKTAKS